ncbi:NBS-LRR-like resistance protein [Rhynchospora pubera]|uniref:NBS-LRR-like resistance protein n=1 Tax=Rhynchospora pubera TaxID=906938 RepID=A0AAV8HPQ8_9POAL|nr:NBS-LRR-like resistance protein [Rhynchospora pubera]
MADLLVSAVIPAVLKKVGDSLVQRIGEMWGIDDQRERLHSILLEVQAVLPDAEERVNANLAIKSWLEKIKSAAYDADDLLDEFCYEELRQDAVRHGQKVGNLSGFFSLENPALFQYKMSRKLKKIVGRICDLVVQMRTFRFGQGQHVSVANRAKTDSLVVESEVAGRDEDKEEIVRILLDSSEIADLTIVPVVGMGGLGKTALAQLVYNDSRVQKHFKLSLWVCVSTEFNISLLVKSIIELAMELLKNRLHQGLAGKRFLLVLDDVWNENVDEWKRLRSMLNCGDLGSTIILTTRSGRVVSIMGTVENYNMGCLGEEISWNLFRKRAFSMGVKESRELVEIGKKMVQNCGGLPLAINTLGSLMSYKNELREWLAIYEDSKIWETRSADNQVLPVLKLSYDQLPPYMKQCFAFCAIFPKDYEMDKEKLIQYWMAHGFIPSNGPGSLEMKGSDIFNELAWRSFFHDVKQVCPSTLVYAHRSQKKPTKDLGLSVLSPITLRYGKGDGYCSEIKCKMHDLMHDLAQSIMGAECLSTLETPAQLNQPIIDIRHISTKNVPLDINKTMNCFPSLRSLISTCRNGSGYARNIGFLKSNSLRILEFKVYNRLLEKTRVTPENMKYLRYLELRCSDTLLPEAISTLYLLQTLRLSLCAQLLKLPEGMRYMTSLRHLHIEKCYNLISMPSGFGVLNRLQKLTTYIVGAGLGNSIAELKNLNLHGTLNLYNLREVRDVVNAREANLIAKVNVDNLALCWGKPDNYRRADFEVAGSNDPDIVHCNPHEVLNALKPCDKLKVLQVTQYTGDEFPVWMTEYSMLENLIELYIIDCRQCTNIPPVDKLPFLQILDLKFLNNLIHLCHSGSNSGESGEDTPVAFPSLKVMVLSGIPNLSSWCEVEVENEASLTFPVLKKLDIINCPKLTSMPISPLLEKLSIKGNKTLSCFATRLTTLQGLLLENHGRDAKISNESLSFQPWECLNNLSISGYDNILPIDANGGNEESLTLTKCQCLNLTSCNFILSSDIVPNSSLWFWKCFMFLEELVIRHCENLIYWPEEELRCLICLKSIYVGFCPYFLGSPSKRSITGSLLPKLEFIWIEHCPNLVEIPKRSTSVRGVFINGCPKLQCLPEWLGSMVTLRKLKIVDCEKVQSLPLTIGGLTSLEKLVISRCPNIRVLPEGLLHQLKNLDQLQIECCPHLERQFKNDSKYRCQTSKLRFTKIGGDPVY